MYEQNVIFILRTTVMSLSDVKYDVDINFMYCLQAYTSETKVFNACMMHPARRGACKGMSWSLRG